MLAASLFQMVALSSCKEKEDEEDALQPGEVLQFDVRLNRPKYFPIEGVYKVSPNGRYVAVVTYFNNVAKTEILDVQTGTWKSLAGIGNDGRVTDISNNGNALLFKNDNFFLYNGSTLTQLPRNQQWDKYYLDHRDYLMWMQFSNSSVVSDQLLGRPLSSSTWDTLDASWSGATYTGVVDGWSTFADLASNEFLRFNSETKTWSNQSFTYDFARINVNAGLNRKSVPFAGADGLLYIAGFTGYAKIQNGNATYVDWPQNMIDYTNPMSFEVRENGQVYAVLNSIQGTNLVTYENGVWKVLIEGNAPIVRIYGDQMYYPGSGEGSLSYGLCAEDLNTGKRTVMGEERYESDLEDALLLANGEVLAISRESLIKYSGGRFQQSANITGVNRLLQLNDGRILAFGKVYMYVSDDQGQSWEKVENYLKGENGTTIPHYAQQLGDGSVVLICVSTRRYYNSAVGNTETLYNSIIFKSSDARNWTRTGGIGEANGPVTCVDPVGRMFREVQWLNPITYQTSYIAQRSDDNGQTWKDVDIAVPHVAGANETLYSLGKFHPKEGKIRKWDGTQWLEFNASSNATTMNFFTTGVQNARLNAEGRLVILSNHILLEAKNNL